MIYLTNFKMKYLSLLIALVIVSASCDIVYEHPEDSNTTHENFGKLPTFLEDGSVQAVIEIPAGTTAKREYNYDTNEFPLDIKNGKPRYVDFMGYPGNYGFIPSTLMDPEQGGDGDALDIIVLSQPLTIGQAVSVTPIAVIQLIDNGEIDDKLMAVPTKDDLKTIQATTLAEMETNYSAVKQIIELWFANYKGAGKMQVVGWQDEAAALAAIKKWQLK